MPENRSLEIFLDRQQFWKTRVIVDLSNIQDADDIEQITVVMHDTTEMDEVREAAAVALGRITSDVAFENLLITLKNSSDKMGVLFALIGLRISSHPHVDTVLLETLQNEQMDSMLRRLACYTLGNRKVEAVIPIAKQYIDQPFMIEETFMGSNMAIETLLKFDSVDSSDVIVQWSINAMQNENFDDIQREHAANYLARFADKQHVAILEQLQNHPIAIAKRLYAGSSGNHIQVALERINRSD